MFQVNNFISFHDLTPAAVFLWASASVADCLGWEPEEIIGQGAYDLIHPDDIAEIQEAHVHNVKLGLVGTQVFVRFLHKDGSFIPMEAMFSICYDYIVTCSTIVNTTQPIDTFKEHARARHTRTMADTVDSKREEFDRIHRHHLAFEEREKVGLTWNVDKLEPEPRACMILNRFTRNLVIMYASPSFHTLFGVDPEAIIGKPFLLYIRADDLASFVSEMETAKATTSVAHMRFCFQSPSHTVEIPIEAVLFGAADGMICIMRKCRPFVRKPLIKGSVPPPIPVIIKRRGRATFVRKSRVVNASMLSQDTLQNTNRIVLLDDDADEDNGHGATSTKRTVHEQPTAESVSDSSDEYMSDDEDEYMSEDEDDEDEPQQDSTDTSTNNYHHPSQKSTHSSSSSSLQRPNPFSHPSAHNQSGGQDEGVPTIISPYRIFISDSTEPINNSDESPTYSSVYSQQTDSDAQIDMEAIRHMRERFNEALSYGGYPSTSGGDSNMDFDMEPISDVGSEMYTDEEIHV